MDHRERLECVSVGEKPDFTPVSFWRHFPVSDQLANTLAEATLDWQHRFEFDFVKIMPTGTYSVEDWGVETEPQECRWGMRKVTRLPIRTQYDWEGLMPLDPTAGQLGMVCTAASAVARTLGGRTPVLQTLFTPLTMAYKLAGDRLFRDLVECPEAVERALDVITKTSTDFAELSLKNGVDGFFIASQCADGSFLTLDQYKRFGRPYDLRLLKTIKESECFSLLHIHGEDTFFDELASYPVQMFNWHDQITVPSLTEGLKRIPGTAVGGIDETGWLMTGTTKELRSHIESALNASIPGRFIAGPGCSLELATPDKNIRTVVEHLRSVPLH